MGQSAPFAPRGTALSEEAAAALASEVLEAARLALHEGEFPWLDTATLAPTLNPGTTTWPRRRRSRRPRLIANPHAGRLYPEHVIIAAILVASCIVGGWQLFT